jgi:hypothetical protein
MHSSIQNRISKIRNRTIELYYSLYNTVTAENRQEIEDQLFDEETFSLIREGKEAIRNGEKGIPVKNLFNKIKGEKR